jgi:hypothetical protein
MTKRADFKAIVRARKAATGEKYTVALQKILAQRGVVKSPGHADDGEDRLKDPTGVVSKALERMLLQVWPGMRVDVASGGLFPADDPTPALGRVYRSHFLSAYVPRLRGVTKVDIEVRTGERRPDTSEFRIWAWVGRGDECLEERVDLLSETALNEFLVLVVGVTRCSVPNISPLEPRQQLRSAIESWGHALAEPTDIVTIDTPSLRAPNLKDPRRIATVKTLPVELVAGTVSEAGVDVPCRVYEGPLWVDDGDVNWVRVNGVDLIPYLRARLGKQCVSLEPLGARNGNVLNVRAYFRIGRVAA